MLSKKSISELKKIYLSELGVSLTDEDARRLGLNLLNVFRTVYRPIQKENGRYT